MQPDAAPCGPALTHTHTAVLHRPVGLAIGDSSWLVHWWINRRYPGIRQWLLRMEALPFHTEAHGVLPRLGDVSKIQGGMRAVARANRQAAEIINQASAPPAMLDARL